jgi:D-psicose/D-tagatose/L-ribulose 3-epimerase
MRRLGIHSFVWTDGRTQEGLEKAMEHAAECGYRIIELAYLRPEQFDLDRLSKRAKASDLAIVVTMGLPMSADVSSDDPHAVRAGETLLSNAVKAVRDIGGIRLGGIL